MYTLVSRKLARPIITLMSRLRTCLKIFTHKRISILYYDCAHSKETVLDVSPQKGQYLTLGVNLKSSFMDRMIFFSLLFDNYTKWRAGHLVFAELQVEPIVAASLRFIPDPQCSVFVIFERHIGLARALHGDA